MRAPSRGHRDTVAPTSATGSTRFGQTVRALGPRVLDRRTPLGKQLAAWRVDLVHDLGGEPSTAQLAVIDLAVKTKLLLDSIDAWLLVQPSLVPVTVAVE